MIWADLCCLFVCVSLLVCRFAGSDFGVLITEVCLWYWYWLHVFDDFVLNLPCGCLFVVGWAWLLFGFLWLLVLPLEPWDVFGVTFGVAFAGLACIVWLLCYFLDTLECCMFVGLLMDYFFSLFDA